MYGEQSSDDGKVVKEDVKVDASALVDTARQLHAAITGELYGPKRAA